MTHFDMNPDNLDPRVRQANNVRLRRAGLPDAVTVAIAAYIIFALLLMAAVVYVAAHFIVKYW
jgi:hypothetical protein